LAKIGREGLRRFSFVGVGHLFLHVCFLSFVCARCGLVLGFGVWLLVSAVWSCGWFLVFDFCSAFGSWVDWAGLAWTGLWEC
jgi:hypothetical protein